MIRKDCAYCIDLEKYGALCDHPCRLDGGEPVEVSGCPPRCDTYEKRLSSYEMRERIRKLENELREARHWLDRYSSRDVPLTVERERLKKENEKLRQLVCDMWDAIPKTESCGWDSSANTCTGSDECRGECALWHRMRALGVEVDDAPDEPMSDAARQVFDRLMGELGGDGR